MVYLEWPSQRSILNQLVRSTFVAVRLASSGGNSRGPVDTYKLDSEGLVVRPGAVLVSTESPPEIFHCLLEQPASASVSCRTFVNASSFLSAKHNQGFESLCATPSGARLVTATEASLSIDADGVVRLASYSMTADGVAVPDRE
ncbi:unnamed protein product, partial [Prorocentrum cordatum]